jgi:hypothetical protein
MNPPDTDRAALLQRLLVERFGTGASRDDQDEEPAR